MKGTLCGIASAVFYGTNPFGALSLSHEGIGASSALFYRISIACAILGLVMLVRRQSFRVAWSELGMLALLGGVFAASSLTFFHSFTYLDSGLACSLLFVYPVMVAVLMAVFFKERLQASAAFAMLLALLGIGLLYGGGANGAISMEGTVLIMISALTYAIYIVVVNRGLQMSSVKMTFFVMLFCALTIGLFTVFSDGGIQPLTTPASYFYALMLALVPTVLSLVLMTMSVHMVGSTPTAIMGALDPVTAVVIGVTVFGEVLTFRAVSGMLLILVAVLIIILGKNFTLGKLTSVVGRARKVVKFWRWRPS